MDKMREQFEEWWAPYGYEMMTDGETYYGRETHFAWMAWKASRESLEIEMPDWFDPYGGSGDAAYWAVEVDKAIKNIGIKVKE